ncbi:MAG: serine hydrolase, partial [Rhodobacteraceae bacterium]|nr:beta-lactamase family protein [Alphaproteobacteria bacterium]NNK66094.1 serine hydrolase [Paracoccaceae bacterium]
MTVTRRTFLAGAALTPFSARAQSAPFAAAMDRARGLDQLRSLVIGVGGQVVAAEAVRGPALERPANIKSVSKTIVAALTGIAIDQGALGGPGDRLADIAPRLIPPGADPRVGDITVADLLTMQAGLERTSGRNYGGWVASSNWVANALSRPFVRAPGAGMLYSTGSYHVLGAVLAEVTGESLLSLARAGLGRPLGIEIPAWTRDPQGRYMGGNEMAMSPLALFRVGEAFRQGGRFGETQVVSQDWVDQSFTPRTRSFFSGDRYGYGWFLRDARGHRIAYGRGYGGQMLYVVPSLAMTVVVTSDPNRPARSDGHVGDLNRMLEDLIIPEAEAA